MSTLPLVSIITPSFNQADFLEKTILSVLEQDYPNVEYWVIDGGSTDQSVAIIQKYGERLAGWISEPDHGQAEAINKGLTQTSGEIVAWLNSDDLYHPNAIRSAVAALNDNPGASFVFSDVDSIDQDGLLFNHMRYGDWGLKDLMCLNIIGQPGVFMRRSVLDKAGWLDPSFHYLLDHHLWLRLAAIHEPEYIPGQTWASARIHQSAKNVSQAAGFGPEAIRLAEWIESDPLFQPEAKEYHKRIWAGAYRLNAFYMVEQGKFPESLKMYLQSGSLHPKTALRDWRRIGYAFLSLVGIRNLRGRFDQFRKAHHNRPR